MEAFLVASGIVALAEMGDRTQLLGEGIVRKGPIPLVHGLSAVIFLALGVAAIAA